MTAVLGLQSVLMMTVIKSKTHLTLVTHLIPTQNQTQVKHLIQMKNLIQMKDLIQVKLLIQNIGEAQASNQKAFQIVGKALLPAKKLALNHQHIYQKAVQQVRFALNVPTDVICAVFICTMFYLY